MVGHVKKIDEKSGSWGFIKGEDGTSYFFHRSALVGLQMKDLTVGDEVTFEPGEDTGKGPRAEDVSA